MARIYETPKGGLVDKIVLTTNNQNRISSRDLGANDVVQVDMERLRHLRPALRAQTASARRLRPGPGEDSP